MSTPPARVLWLLPPVLALLAALACDGPTAPASDAALPPPYPWAATRPPLPPRWVFEPWVWEDDANTQEATLALVEGHLSRGLPVGAVIVDSPWEAPGEAGYHSLRFDPARYPDPAAMIEALHRRGVRVVLWTTGNLVPEAPTYAEACRRGFFVRRVSGSGERCPTTSFWKGSGRASHLDFFHPEAVLWWRGLLDRALDLGADGFKVDGSDLQLAELGERVRTHAGEKTPAEYSAAMYRAFLDQTRRRRGAGGAILARPFAVENGVARWYAPLDAGTASWVGDQARSFEGLREALLEIFVSARAGYPVVGSDVGGFRPEGDGLPDPRLFVRWAQLGALLPLMETGGRGEHRPWAFGPEVLAVYRRFARLHHALAPYLHHLAVEAHRTGAPVVRPLGPGPERWSGDWRYLLGEDLLVAALEADVPARDVRLPDGAWHDWWEPATRHAGGTTVRVATPLDRYPLFVRSGAVLPLAGEDGATTLLVFPGGPDAGRSERRLRLGPDATLTVTVEALDDGLTVSLGAGRGDWIVRVLREGGFVEHRLATDGAPASFRVPSGIVGDPPSPPQGALP